MIISIIIPTRDRVEYLEHAIKTCLVCDDPNIEIIISNNNSQDNTEEMVKSFDDPRIAYYNTGKDLSMRENFEFSLSKATGDYAIMIGDDDGVLKNGIATLRHLIKKYNNPDIINWRHITYFWPDSIAGGKDGVLKFKKNNFFGEVKVKNPSQILQQLCDGSLTGYKEGGNLYHGCVSLRLINSIKEKTKLYFLDTIPDVYASFANLSEANKIVWVRNPITIGGESKKSNGAAVLSKKNRSTEQKKISDSFSGLASTDPVKPEMDYNLKALAALSYTALNRMNRELLNGKHQINHERWRIAVRADIKKLAPESQKASSILAEELFVRLDPSYKPQEIKNVNLGQKPITSEKKVKKQINYQHKVTVFSIAQWIDTITGSPHKIFFKNVALARLFWTFKMAGMTIREKLYRFS